MVDVSRAKEIKHLMDANRFGASMTEMGRAILAKVRLADLMLVGIHRRGALIALRIAEQIEKETKNKPLIGMLRIELYNDNLTEKDSKPIVKEIDLPDGVEESTVVLVDDVLFTGRTLDAAVDVVKKHGARNVYSAVLVDRGHRKCQIDAEIVHTKVETKWEDQIKVELKEIDGHDGVLFLVG